MIDIVIPLGKGSVWDNNELRLSLRSIEKYLTGYRSIYIVGEYPEWLQNCIHVPINDTEKISDKNIMHKIAAACLLHEVSETFIMFNDDHYLLSPYHAPGFPYYYHKNLTDYITQRRGDIYAIRATNTLNHLKANNLPAKFFDCHTPILYNKQAFLGIVNSADWDNSRQGYIIKSLYANSLSIEGVELINDHKYQVPTPAPLMSTFPRVSAAMRKFLFEQFDKPSKFER
jgi:hypothetical protein